MTIRLSPHDWGCWVKSVRRLLPFGSMGDLWVERKDHRHLHIMVERIKMDGLVDKDS